MSSREPSPYLSPNNREPFPLSISSPKCPYNYGFRRPPLETLPPNPLEVINKLYEQLADKECEVEAISNERTRLQEHINELNGKINLLKGEILESNQKLNQARDKAHAQAIEWEGEYRSMVEAVDELKEEAVKRYVEHLDFRCSTRFHRDLP